jgi:hypothetical protein
MPEATGRTWHPRDDDLGRRGQILEMPLNFEDTSDGLTVRARYARIASPDPSFARVMGPWLVIVPGIVALRRRGWVSSHPNSSKTEFVWCGRTAAVRGLVIIAFHQYWSSVAAVIISLFGWILSLRGLVLMAAPKLYERVRKSASGGSCEQ